MIITAPLCSSSGAHSPHKNWIVEFKITIWSDKYIRELPTTYRSGGFLLNPVMTRKLQDFLAFRRQSTVHTCEFGLLHPYPP
ncbi:hypothetical protein HTH_1079 [Hydrogenobacter thermophilus TK-6]|uniref:Uncharacterized protein n=1 Tax=Hydrogenobacter thermophilus (strain DSM 6534 / IAM 12695 / TK-6) TaxID=608538 RepID=D3DI85_HYDTT|nr:hypothetical protein HTH_1079 [Hydrogenobacter thermophilus TK-6]